MKIFAENVGVPIREPSLPLIPIFRIRNWIPLLGWGIPLGGNRKNSWE